MNVKLSKLAFFLSENHNSLEEGNENVNLSTIYFKNEFKLPILPTNMKYCHVKRCKIPGPYAPT